MWIWVHTTCWKANILSFFSIQHKKKISVTKIIYHWEIFYYSSFATWRFYCISLLGYVAVALGVLRLFSVSDARQNEPLENMDFLWGHE